MPEFHNVNFDMMIFFYQQLENNEMILQKRLKRTSKIFPYLSAIEKFPDFMKDFRFGSFAFLLFPLVSIFNLAGFAQWKQTNGPNTGNILSFTGYNSNHVYTGTKKEGIYRTEDWVGTWSKITTNGLSDSTVNGILRDQSGNLFTATPNGVYILNQPVNTLWSISGLAGEYVKSIALSETNFLWAATTSGVYIHKYGVFPWAGIFGVDTMFNLVSHQNTESWMFEPPTTLSDVSCVIPGFASNGYQLYKYNALKQKWQVVTYPSGILLKPVLGKIILQSGNFVMTEQFVSHDFGNTWTALTTFPHVFPTCLLRAGTNLYASGENGVFVSTNDGQTWTAINNNLSNLNVKTLTTTGFTGTEVYAGTSGGGIFRYDNALNKWDPIGISSYSRIKCLGAFGNDLYAGLTSLYRGIYVAKNSQYGINWACKTNGIPASGFFVNTFAFMDTGNVVLAGTHLGIYRSADRGETWTIQGNGSIVSALYMASKGIRAVAGNGNQIFLSNDNGVVWGNITNNLASLGVSIRDATFDQMGNIFVATSGGIYISSDNGATWSQRGMSSAFKIASAGSRLYAGSYGNILTSDDYGNNWTSQYVDQNNLNQVTAIVPSGGFVFTSIGKKVYRSANFGSSWEAFSTPLRSDVSSLAIRDTVLVAGTQNHGAWKCRVGLVTENHPTVSQQADLLVYPNPGQGQITIELPEGLMSEITIFAVTGTKIQEKTSPSEFSRMSFLLNSGIYIARAKVGERYVVKRFSIE